MLFVGWFLQQKNKIDFSVERKRMFSNHSFARQVSVQLILLFNLRSKYASLHRRISRVSQSSHSRTDVH